MKLLVFFVVFNAVVFGAPVDKSVKEESLPFRPKIELDSKHLQLMAVALEKAAVNRLDLTLYKAYLFEYSDEYVVIFWDAKRDSIGGYSPDVSGLEVVFDRKTLALISANFSR